MNSWFLCQKHTMSLQSWKRLSQIWQQTLRGGSFQGKAIGIREDDVDQEEDIFFLSESTDISRWWSGSRRVPSYIIKIDVLTFVVVQQHSPEKASWSSILFSCILVFADLLLSVKQSSSLLQRGNQDYFLCYPTSLHSFKRSQILLLLSSSPYTLTRFYEPCVLHKRTQWAWDEGSDDVTPTLELLDAQSFTTSSIDISNDNLMF